MISLYFVVNSISANCRNKENNNTDMFYVKQGVPAVWIKNVDVSFQNPFFTRRDLIFLPHERIKAQQGKMAFRREGYVLILDAKYVSVSDEVSRSIDICLNRLSNMVQKEDDQKTLVSLAQ